MWGWEEWRFQIPRWAGKPLPGIFGVQPKGDRKKKPREGLKTPSLLSPTFSTHLFASRLEENNALGHCQDRTEQPGRAWTSLSCWRDEWAEQDRVQSHWEIPAWPWHSLTPQIPPLKPSQKHWGMLLSDQQQGREFVVQKMQPRGRGWSRSSPRDVAAPGRKSCSLHQSHWNFLGNSWNGD